MTAAFLCILHMPVLDDPNLRTLAQHRSKKITTDDS